MLLRVHTNDGRTEDLHLSDDATIADLRRSIADAFVVMSGADRIRIRVHEPFQERLRRRLSATKPLPSHQPDAVILDKSRSSTALATIGVRHLSTIVVENCDEISSRPFYSVIRRLRSLKESERGRQKAALDLMRKLMADRILEPDRVSVPVEEIKPVLEGADCYSILSPLGVVLKGDRFLLDNVTSSTARQVLFCLCGRQEWDRTEAEQIAIRSAAAATPPPKPKPKSATKPKPVPERVPDYSQQALYVFVAVLFAGLLISQYTRRSSEKSFSEGSRPSRNEIIEDSIGPAQPERPADTIEVVPAVIQGGGLPSGT